MIIFVKNKHTLQIDEFKFKCSIGKKGLTNNKKEGDKKTPKGVFGIGNLYFRKDHVEKPLTALKCIEIKKDMAWCDDVRFPKNYNSETENCCIIKKMLSFLQINYCRSPFFRGNLFFAVG